MLNGMIYIGQHTTTNPNDDYMGSGKYIIRAIKKYGIENFKKEILFECSSQEELNAKERELVNEDFVNRDDTYNLVLGGIQGLSHEQAVEFGRKGQKKLQKLLEDPNKHKEFCKKVRQHIKRLWKDNPEIYRKFRYDSSGKHHSDETKMKMREKGKLRTGAKNSMFGRMWIHNELVQVNATIEKAWLYDYMEQGWKVGRVVNWDKYFADKLRKDKRKKFHPNTTDRCIDNLDKSKKYYSDLLPMFLKYPWKVFVNMSGYKYSNQNFHKQIEVYLNLTRPKLKVMKEKYRDKEI